MYYFIINPKSRTGMGAEVWQQVQAKIKQKKLPYRHFFTEYRGHATKLAKSICSQASPGDCLTVIGGDGTIQEVLTGIPFDSPIFFAYIPAGSGNDFARGMKIPKNPEEALKLLLSRPKPLPMDVGTIRAENRTGAFGISCGMGFDAAICHAALSSRMKAVLNRIHMGKLTYAFLAVRLLFSFRPFTLSLTLDGKTQTYEKVYFAAVMNQPFEDGGFCFCPAARSDDGFLDVILVHKVSKLKLLFCFPTALFARHTGIKGVTIFRCRKAELISSHPVPIHQDGESAGIGNRLTADLRPQQLPVISSRKQSARQF